MEILIISIVLFLLILSNVCVFAYLYYLHAKDQAPEFKTLPVETKPKPVKGKRTPFAHPDEVLWQKEEVEKKNRTRFV